MLVEPDVTNMQRPNEIQVRNDSTLKYLPNADFQMWFKPVLWRAAIGIAAMVPITFLLGVTGLLPIVLGHLTNYLRIFRPFLTESGGAVLAPWIAMASNISTPIFVFVGLVIAYLTCKLATEPDILTFDEHSLRFGRVMRKYEMYTTMIVSKKILWSEISKIDIIRPANTRSNLDYCFELQRYGDPWIKIRFGDIVNEADRQSFLNILKGRFSTWVDDEAVAAFAPPSDRQSYTELWLSELSAAPKRDRLTPLEVGTRLYNQKYQVVNKIGVGGQSTVYLALCGNEEVVLKEFVLPVYPDKGVRKAAAVRFQDEANLLTKLNHKQIVKLKDLFLEDHRAYLVLEHLPGQNLKDLVANQGPLPASEIKRLAKQMCAILTYLHGQQPPVVHRDFTPDNLMLDSDGQIKLIDFSVAQSLTSNVTGSVVGKPHYIAPEQFRGKPTAQSDIYALGATLFYLATGHDPEPISALRLQEFKPDCDKTLAAIIERATKLDVQHRYRSADEILQQLS